VSVATLALVVGQATVGIGQTLIYTVLGPAAREIGVTELQSGAIISISALVLTFASPFWGRLIDRYGARRAYLVGMLSYSIGSLLFAWILHLGLVRALAPLATLFCLIAARGLYAFMTAGIFPAAMAYTAHSTDESKRSAGMALMSASFVSGSILGPVVGAALAATELVLPIYVAAALAFLGFCISFFSLEKNSRRDSLERKISTRYKRKNKAVIFIFLGMAFAYFAYSSLQQSLSFYVQDVFHLTAAQTVKETGYFIAVLAVSMVVTQAGMAKLAGMSPRVIIMAGAALAVSGLLTLSISSTSLQICFAQVMIGIGLGLFLPGLQTWASMAVPSEEQGAIAGLTFSAQALGYVVGPVLGSYLFRVSHPLTYVFGAAAIFFALVFVSRVHGKMNIPKISEIGD
jgi:MFS family permease